MGNPLAVSTNTYHGFGLMEAVEGIQSAGFSLVELTGVPGYTEHVNWRMSASDLAAVKKILADHGLQPLALSGHSNLLTYPGVENFIRNIELAGRLKCQYIITSVGEAHGDEATVNSQTESKLIETLQKLAARCESAGIKLAIETHGRNYPTGTALLPVIEKAGSPYIGIAYDTANVIFYGQADPAEDILQAIDKVFYIHLKDKLGRPDEWNFPALGTGYVDFPAIFTHLQRHNYRGPFSVEIEFTGTVPETVNEVHAAVQTSSRYLQQIWGQSSSWRW